MKYISNIDLNKNELQNARIQNLATAPASPVSGQFYYNTSDNNYYGYNGTAWLNLSLAIAASSTNGNIKINGVETTVYTHPGTGTNPHGTTMNDIGIQSGADASKPTATGSGIIYFATDIKKIWKDTASGTWTQMGGQDTIDWSKITNTPSTYTPPIASASTLGGIKVGANLSIDANGVLTGNSNPTSYIIKQQKFIATEGQTVFNITNGSYITGLGALSVFINGSKQSAAAFTETSTTSFTLKSGVNANDVVLGEYIQLISVTPYPVHANQHLPGGTDPIPAATESVNGLMSAADKTKLDNIAAGANNYVLPAATSGALGGVKSGSDISVDSNGNVTLVFSGVTAGTYTKVTVDTKGRVTAATNLTVSDIPTLDHTKISDFDTQVRTSRIDQMAAPTANVSMGNKNITNLADPVNPQDAVTKNYADNLRAGLSLKDPVQVATTGSNITLSGLQTIDGYTTVAGDRVLVKDQTTASQNGIYIAASGAWARSTDTDNSPTGEIKEGMTVWVDNGTINGNSRWVQVTADPITIGTTSLSFTKDFSSSDIIAGTGITKTGNTIGLTSGVATPGTYPKVTVDQYGRVTSGSALASSDVTTALGYTPVKKYSANIGDGSSTTITVNHALNTTDITVAIRETASPYNGVITDWQMVDANNIKLLFATAPTSAQYRVVVTG